MSSVEEQAKKPCPVCGGTSGECVIPDSVLISMGISPIEFYTNEVR